MRLSVIVSTYNSPDSLLRTLHSLEGQTCDDFEIIVADDGSNEETAVAVRRAQSLIRRPIHHIWHEDEGFRKNTILNQSVLAASGDYLIFIDGDCIARNDLIEAHARCARRRQMLSGGSQIDIPNQVHPHLTREAILAGEPFDPEWLERHGLPIADDWEKRLRLVCKPPLSRLLDFAMPRRAGFVGCNSSAWKDDILEVNGFDEQIAYGVDDKDLGVRLINSGVRSRRLKYSLVYLHLDHQRSYADQTAIRRNKTLVKKRRHQGTTWIGTGIEKHFRRHAA